MHDTDIHITSLLSINILSPYSSRCVMLTSHLHIRSHNLSFMYLCSVTCTSAFGWVTGHSYILYGPLANGAITLLFEGVPNYPDSSRMGQVVDKHKVNILYTAPTAIRADRKSVV